MQLYREPVTQVSSMQLKNKAVDLYWEMADMLEHSKPEQRLSGTVGLMTKWEVKLLPTSAWFAVFAGGIKPSSGPSNNLKITHSIQELHKSMQPPKTALSILCNSF